MVTTGFFFQVQLSDSSDRKCATSHAHTVWFRRASVCSPESVCVCWLVIYDKLTAFVSSFTVRVREECVSITQKQNFLIRMCVYLTGPDPLPPIWACPPDINVSEGPTRKTWPHPKPHRIYISSLSMCWISPYSAIHSFSTQMLDLSPHDIPAFPRETERHRPRRETELQETGWQQRGDGESKMRKESRNEENKRKVRQKQERRRRKELTGLIWNRFISVRLLLSLHGWTAESAFPPALRPQSAGGLTHSHTTKCVCIM